MASLKSLFKDTAIYGMSSIVGRFLNYLLVPLYTNVINAAEGGFGVITNVYAYTALLLVILTYGMETTFFRFMNKEGENPQMVYRVVLTMVGITSTLFAVLVCLFIGPISSWMGYADHPSYVWTMAVVIALDAFQAIPFAYMRYQKRPVKFAALKMLFIVLSIALNMLFFLVFYDPAVGVGYAFYINLACTSSVTLFMYKEIGAAFKGGSLAQNGCRWQPMVKAMLSYAWPILVLGIAGILNQTADKILFPHIYPDADADVQLGIYGAAVKIAMIMALITQAFRYAYEPFVFAGAAGTDQKTTYAKAMKFFLLFTLLAFLMVVGYMDLLRYIIGESYWDGLRVVPVVMAAEIMMGIYFNLSFWYKLTDQTIWGAVFSGIGCIVLITINVLFVPEYGYMACAWGGVGGYGVAMVLSYIVGQKKYPIDYNLPELLCYTALALFCYAGMWMFDRHSESTAHKITLNTFIIAAFAASCIFHLRKRKKPKTKPLS
ncbi:MAG: lipopolysaccharide biosynthesis protein [Bacteroidaceae bacterium]|nr:lipopolysaccharide biosynthesis protein [Bacteroidaceae bacterium]